MASIATINGGDTLSASRADINNNFANLNTDKIEAADVTFANLNANSDVGPGATQVAQGDHGHAQLHNEAHDIASHSDTGATGPELDQLTDNSNADSLHTHSLATVTPTVQVITANGTWTKPANLRYVVIELVGGGGGGGYVNSANNASASGGGGGGYSRKIFDESELSATETVTIGIGGIGGIGSTLTSGLQGGTTKFADGKGYEVNATGGGGVGGAGFGNRGGNGGVGSGGDFNAAGDGGSGGANMYNTDFGGNGPMHSGKGGASLLGGGANGFGAGANGNDVSGEDALPNGYGGGGGGGSSDNLSVDGGDATGGVIIITEYY